MPYSGKEDSDIPAYVPDEKKAQWVNIWNSVYEQCILEDGDVNGCEAEAFKQANGAISKENEMRSLSLWGAAVELLREIGRKLSETVHPTVFRSICMPDLYGQVSTLLDERFMNGESNQWEWLTDIYVEDNRLFGIIAAGGKLYRSEVSVAGDMVSMGDMHEVVHDFKPVYNKLKVRREADGRLGMFLLTETSVINRNGEIDSAQLFDDMIERCERTGEYPYLDFFHLGEETYMGRADWVARDGVVAIAHVVLEDNLLARAFERSYNADPDYWGCSNMFFPLEEPEMWEVSKDIRIPVYKRGIWEAITILPEKDACSLFTAVLRNKEVRMDKRIMEAIAKLANGDAELEKELSELVDGINRTVDSDNLVHRSSEEEALPDETEVETETEVEVEAEEEVAVEGEQVAILDDAAVRAIVDAFVQSEPYLQAQFEAQKAEKELLAQLSELTERMAELQKTQDKRFEDMEKRLVKTERTDEDKKREYLNDLPSKPKASTVTYRPRETRSSEETTEVPERSLSSIAEETLAKL